MIEQWQRTAEDLVYHAADGRGSQKNFFSYSGLKTHIANLLRDKPTDWVDASSRRDLFCVSGGSTRATSAKA